MQVVIPGVEGGRAFSIANSPRRVRDTGIVELNVRLVPGGAGTRKIHEGLAVGESFAHQRTVRALLRPQIRRRDQLLFMAGGSGLSSPLSMITDLLGKETAVPSR